MVVLPTGAVSYSDVFELTYDLLNEIGLAINMNGCIYDQDNGALVNFQGRKMKCYVDPNHPCYAGQGEVMFDIINNIRLVTTLFGYCIDKETAMNPEFSSVSQFIEELPDSKATAMSIKLSDGSVRTTEYYNNKCLKYVEAMFLVYDDKVDLHNFDSLEE